MIVNIFYTWMFVVILASNSSASGRWRRLPGSCGPNSCNELCCRQRTSISTYSYGCPVGSNCRPSGMEVFFRGVLHACRCRVISPSEYSAEQPGKRDSSPDIPGNIEFGVGRVIGGTTASISNWPWQASLTYGGRHTCGAIIIDNSWLITAAHCVIGRTQSLLRIIVGSTNRNSGVEYTINSISVHPDYSENAPGFPNDIALLNLNLPLVFGSNVANVRIANPGQSFLNNECWITGWGRTSSTSSLPLQLRQAEIPVISNNLCRRMMNRVSFAAISNRHICIHAIGRNSCHGDSGGPLTCRASSSSEWYVVGTASWVVGRCADNFPAVYTRLSEYKRWIIQETGLQFP